jgi:PiT family inorganic phosphate transporter
MERRKADSFLKKGRLQEARQWRLCMARRTAEVHWRFPAWNFLAGGQTDVTTFTIPIWLMILCSLVMSLGTSIGGCGLSRRSAWIWSSSINIRVLGGYRGGGLPAALVAHRIPVSTTHTKTTAIMGVGASKRISSVNWGVVKEMVYAWVLTFPCCGLVGYLMVKLFLAIF